MTLKLPLETSEKSSEINAPPLLIIQFQKIVQQRTLQQWSE